MSEKPYFPEFLRVSALTQQKLPPFAIENGTETVHVYDAKLILLLSHVLAFKFQVFIPPDGQYGSSLPDGNWTGMVGMVHQGKADIAISQVGISEERMTVVDFSYPYHFSPVTFITDKPQYLRSSYAILHPFSLSVWIAIAVSFVFMLLLSYAFRGKKDTFANLTLGIYGNLLEQSAANLSLRRLSSKFLMTSWGIAALILTFSYKAVLLSFLSFPTSVGIRNIEQLAAASESSSFVCSTYPGSYIHPALLKAHDLHSKQIAKCLKRSDLLTRDIEEFVSNPQFKKVFIEAKSELDMLSQGFFVSDDAFFTIMAGIVVSKKFCCKKVLDEVVHKVAAVGLLQKIHEDEEFHKALAKSYLATEELSPNQKLSLEDVAGAFIFLTFGYVLGAAVLIGEVVLSRKRRK